MGNTFASSDARNLLSTPLREKSSAVPDGEADLIPHQGEKVRCNILLFYVFALTTPNVSLKLEPPMILQIRQISPPQPYETTVRDGEVDFIPHQGEKCC